MINRLCESRSSTDMLPEATTSSYDTYNADMILEATQPSACLTGRSGAALWPMQPLKSQQPLRASSSDASKLTQADVEQGRESLHHFLRKLEAVRSGSLQEFEAILKESNQFHIQALHAASPTTEREALASVEALAERASGIVSKTNKALQELAMELYSPFGLNATDINLRQQSFSAVTVLYQNALNAFFQAQQSFRSRMEAKLSRQLKVAFPEAEEAALQQLASGRDSAASAIQDTMLRQPGTGPLSTSMALELTRARCDDLERLVQKASELRRAFADIELLVSAQGGGIDDVSGRTRAAREQTQAGLEHLEDILEEHLEGAHAARRRLCRWRRRALVLLIVAFLVVGVISVLLHHVSFRAPWVRTASEVFFLRGGLLLHQLEKLSLTQ